MAKNDSTDFEDNLYHERLPNVGSALSNKAKTCCSVESVKRTLPILTWMPNYRLNFLLSDFLAGLTVGLTTIPQALAYATVAGLPPEYGLYSAFMGCFVYIFFGTSESITVGPTAIMSLMVQIHIANTGSNDFAVLACFMTGIIILVMGILNLGALVQFISVPVVTGFTTAAAITIASGQINSLFGIKSSNNEFLASWINFFGHITETRRNDAILGVCTLILFLLMRKIKDIPCQYKMLKKYITLSRNAFAVIIGILLCYYLSHDDWLPFRVSGEINAGLPQFKLPPFHTNINNGTELNFGEMLQSLGASLVSIPVISILEAVAIAKAFSKGKIVDASQEMIAIGLCNLLSSFFSSMPITGSFTRSAINNSSGVKTQLGGAVTGGLVLLALGVLTKTFYYIPKSTLAAIIIAAMIFMIEYDRIVEIWRSKKMDLFPFLVTVLTCLFWSLEYGIVCGVVANLIFILYKSARPRILLSKEKINGIEVILVTVLETLCYSSAEYLKAKVIKFVNTQVNGSENSLVIIKGDEINSIDSTVALNVISLKEDLTLLNSKLLCWNWPISAAGVICRLHKSTRSMFVFNGSLQEIVYQEEQSLRAVHTSDTDITLVP